MCPMGLKVFTKVIKRSKWLTQIILVKKFQMYFITNCIGTPKLEIECAGCQCERLLFNFIKL